MAGKGILCSAIGPKLVKSLMRNIEKMRIHNSITL